MDRSAGLLKLSRRLDDEHLVLRYDRRGYGRSARTTGRSTWAPRSTTWPHCWRGGRPSIGHSYGGNVALALAARQPELVRGIAVYETPLSWLTWWPTTTAGGDALTVRDGHGADPADAAERFMRRLVGDERWSRLPRTRRARRARVRR